VPNFKRKLSTSLYWAFFCPGFRQDDTTCLPDENQDDNGFRQDYSICPPDENQDYSICLPDENQDSSLLSVRRGTTKQS
jgi:hypothetical protein